MSASECEATVSPIVERCSVCNTEEWERVGDDDGDEDDHRVMADEARRVKKFQNPRMPSKEEIEDHEVAGHLPFRPWRTHCVRGKGHEQAHFRQPGREDGLPEAHLDYAFIGSRSEKNEAGDSKLMPVLVMRKRRIPR